MRITAVLDENVKLVVFSNWAALEGHLYRYLDAFFVIWYKSGLQLWGAGLEFVLCYERSSPNSKAADACTTGISWSVLSASTG